MSIVFNKFKHEEKIFSEENEFIVKCSYGACVEKCIAYQGYNNFFYSMETHNLLPVTEWAFIPSTDNKDK